MPTPAHGSERIGRHPGQDELLPGHEVTFWFDGQPVSGYAGEPIIAALLAAGRRVLRTMPRTGDSRGGYCLVGRCADCLVVVDGVPDVLGCRAPVAAGLRVETQRGLGDWGSGG